MFLKRSFQYVFSALLVVMMVSQLVSQKTTNIIIIGFIMVTVWLYWSKLKLPTSFQSSGLKKILVCIFTIINIGLLLYVALQFQINDVSDPLNVQIKATELLNGNYNWHTNTNGNEEYFYVYPNVVIFTILLSKVMGIGVAIGLPIQITLRLFIFLLLSGVTLFSLLTTWTLTKKVSNLLWTSLVLMVYPVLYLYPNMVTYTDTATMFLTTLVIYLVAQALTIKNKISLSLIYVAITIVFATLYAIKPNMIILLPAVIGVLVLCIVLRKPKIVQIAVVSLALFSGLILVSLTTNKITAHYGFDSKVSKTTSLPVTHWINMGLNPMGSNGSGSYDMNDDNNARQSATDNNKDLINQSLKYRVKELGVSGIFKISLDKAQMLLGTPLFGYGKYMSGFDKAPKYYLKHQSMFNNLFSIIATTVLLCCAGGLLIRTWQIDAITEDTREVFLYFVGIASIGLALFHTVVWEVEPRYFLPMLYPLLLLNTINEKPLTIKQQISLNVPRGLMVAVPTLAFILLTLGLQSSRTSPSVAYGNMEYPVRLNFIKPVSLSNTMSFTLQVPQPIDTLKINIQPQPGLEVTLADGTQLMPQNNQYVIVKHFDNLKDVKVIIKNQNDKSVNIFLYERTDLFKPLFHGSSISFHGLEYYLPYEMDIFDKSPLQTWNYNSGIPQQQ